MTAPNLYLLGPHKCGTSSLYAELLRHPKICPMATKETFFLVDRGSPFFDPEANIATRGEDGWRRLARQEGGLDGAYLLEACTHHIFQETAREYLESRPELRGLIVLRDPARRIRSSFYYTRNNLSNIDPSITFAQYVEDLLAGSPLPYVRHASSRWVLSRELAFSDYRAVLSRWRPLIEQGQVRVWTFERFVSAPADLLDELTRWLGLPPAPEPLTAAKNFTYVPRSHTLHSLARRVNRSLQNSPLRLHASRVYRALMTTRRDLGDDAAALAKLRQRYRPDYEDLENDYGIDTSAWNR